ncbi:cytochrome P450 [Pseudonocardia spinosispora]|uniref:cytochrome P450 n=1 Tax=Pseudonocardia spinosispora TaxID=103441 RepID=UPI00041C4E64|nr:cytochrome P450 [Pseudonocardia spinosispora]
MSRAQPDTDVDLSDLDGFWTRPIEERHAVFNALRDQPGLPFFAEREINRAIPAGPGYYALTRLDDIAEASRRPKLFTSGQGATNIADLPKEFLEFYGSMINMDDPRHSRLRRIVSRGFTPRRLDALTENVGRVASTIVDDIIDAGECEAVRSISARLPLTIVCDMMGIPESQHDFVFDRTNVILGATDPEYVPEGTDIFTALLQAGGDLTNLVRELAALRAENPTDDLISALINAEIDGESLTPDELASFFILLVVAGNETTRTAISWGITALTRYPEQRERWLADLDKVTPTAVEEIVRWASPVMFMRRTVAEATALGGQELSAGDKVLLFYWAGNRDPKYFLEPEKFDVLRSPNAHIGFGGPGPHFCLGAHLARREISVMFRELLTRIPDIHATAEPVRLKSSFINGIKHLPVAFTPGGAR